MDFRIGERVKIVQTGQAGNVIGFARYGDVKVKSDGIEDYAILAPDELQSIDEATAELTALRAERDALAAEVARLRGALEKIAHCPVSPGEQGYMVLLYEARQALGIPTPYDDLTDDDIGEGGF